MNPSQDLCFEIVPVSKKQSVPALRTYISFSLKKNEARGVTIVSSQGLYRKIVAILS